MKTFLRLVYVTLLVAVTSLQAQVHQPVTWKTSVIKNNKDQIFLVATAHIKDGWHLYSQFVKEGGPIPTTFYYPKEIKLIGKTIEGKGVVVQDPTFLMEVKYFGNLAEFKQQIEIKEAVTTIKASVEFMACNDQMCLPPKEVDLIYDVSSLKETTLNTVKETSNLKEQKGYGALFLLSFLAGLTALLTPCVFPMIPMTVSFFTKRQKSKWIGIKNAIIYGVAIIVIYVLLGTFVVAVFGSAALNELATSVTFNLVFFVVLVFFAFSFLGAYELVLPSSWGTKLDEKADKGGLLGIFFMALALAVVSFSCTGPIVGTALVESASRGGVAPIVSMLGFSSAIALPFTLFAIFPSWLNSLPKSGGWLNTVKVVLGFLELLLAFKFLSNADLVLQAHWLEREVFIAIWMVLFLLLGLYLLGKLRLPHDYQPVEKVSVFRLLLAATSLFFVMYLLPGLFGAPVKLVGAFVPPMNYSSATLPIKENHSFAQKTTLPDGAHLFAPYNIVSFTDYEKGVAYAQKVNKPILLDFTGYACVNCRKMEQNVWSDKQVLSLLQNKLVLISLHVDDRQPFDEKEISPLTGKPYRYKGQKWAHFQEMKYGTNSQPYYVILNAKGNAVGEPIGYTPNVKKYLNWLQKGVNNAH